MKQCHGNTVAEVNQTSPLITENVDALVTVSREIVLGVKTADCIPLIFFDPIYNITSAVHAGYKGLLVGIIQNTLRKMAELGSTISNVMVGVGPCICKSCYNVEKERIDMFSENYPGMETFYEKKSDTYLLDIKAIALYLLHTNGIQKDNIEISPFCTKEDNEKFFSRRVEEKGVFLSVIGMI
jgi:YfiH family protein